MLTDQDRGEYQAAMNGTAPPMWRIPNTVARVEPPRADLSAKRIFAAGRYTAQKGYDMLIPAFAPVAEAHPGWELKLCGRGKDTQKLRDLAADPHLNLSYYKDRTREWISVSGIARVTSDREKIHELYARDWKMWFGEEGDPRHGTKDDPRMADDAIDAWLKPYERTGDTKKAAAEYLSWEVDLLPRIARDGTTNFIPFKPSA